MTLIHRLLHHHLQPFAFGLGEPVDAPDVPRGRGAGGLGSAHRNRRWMGTSPDTIDWRSRPIATVLVFLGLLAFIALCGLAGAEDVAREATRPR